MLYATTPGAFVDLAADLSFLQGAGFAAAELDQHRGLPAQADITGAVTDGSNIHQALGVLIAGGRTREQADARLDALSGHAQSSRAVAARRLLSVLPRRPPPSR